MSGYVKAKYGTENGILTQALARRLSGSALRERRHEFALHADIIGREKTQGRSIMLTRPLPTKTLPPEGFWQSLDATWTAIHSTQLGSLYHLLMTLHARRFRLFPKVGARQAFIGQAQIAALGLDRQFSTTGLLEAAPKLTATALYESLTMQMRGKGEATQAEPLLKRFVQAFGVKALPKEGDLTLPIHRCLHDVAEALAGTFPTWPALRERAGEGLEIVETVLGQHGYELSGLSRLATAFEQIQAVSDNAAFAKATIHFDASRPRVLTADPTERFYLVCAAYAAEAQAAGEEAAPFAQEAMTTINGNGLSWLFNDGIRLLQETPLEDMARELGVAPDKVEEMEDLDAVVTAAKAFTAPQGLGASAAKSSRVALQGALDSLITTHLKRLKELHAALSTPLATEVLAPIPQEYAVFFQGVEVHHDEYNRLLAQLDGERLCAENAVAALLGLAPLTADALPAHLAAFNDYIELLSMLGGTLNKIINHCDIARTAGLTDLDLPKKNPALIPPDALVVIHDRLIDPAEDRARQKAEFDQLKAAFGALMSRLTSTYDLSYARTIAERTRSMEALRQSSESRLSWASPQLLSVREVLSKITQTVYRCTSSDVRKAYLDLLISHGIVPRDPSGAAGAGQPDKAAKRDWMRLINENKGTVFVNPRDRARKYLVPCDNDRLLSLNLFDLLASLLEPNDLVPRDRFMLEQQWQSLLLQGLPAELPSAELDDFVRTHCQPNLRPLLREPMVERQTAIKALSSSYLSRLSGLLYKLNKLHFIDTRSFAVWESPVLAYVPKPGVWKVPATYHSGILADVIDTYGVAGEGGLDVLATAKAVIRALTTASDLVPEALQARNRLLHKLLLQLPHEWGAVLDIPHWGEERYCYLMDRGQGKLQSVIPVSVPVAFNRDIDRVLAGEKSSPPRLVFERTYRVEDDVVREETHKRRVTVNVPITLTGTPEDTPWTPDYVLGIDPGEFGIGLGLVDLDGNEIDRCFVSLPVVRAFRDQLQSHRQKVQPRQKYRALYFTHLEQLKEAAIGEMTSIIESLMFQLNAFPVIEMPDATRSSDRIAQLSDNLLQNFCWGDNDAQNTARVSHWMGANRWSLPWINATTGEPIRGYPGVRVGSFGNSQLCPACRRNPLLTLREMVEHQGCKSLSIGEGGLLELHNGMLRLERMDVSTYDHNLKRKRQPDHAPVAAGDYGRLALSSPSYKDLRTLFINSLWRSNPDRAAKQSRQSMYHCLYADCLHTTNSEAAAGINIARKFVGRLKKPDATIASREPEEKLIPA